MRLLNPGLICIKKAQHLQLAHLEATSYVLTALIYADADAFKLLKEIF